jgi:hypothetical protein
MLIIFKDIQKSESMEDKKIHDKFLRHKFIIPSIMSIIFRHSMSKNIQIIIQWT